MKRSIVAMLAMALLAAACSSSDSTDAPESTGAPETAQAPEETDVPEETDAPEATEAPEGRSEIEQAMADAIRDGILEDNGSSEANPFGVEEATCIGNRAVDEIGLEGLLEIGITVENANPDDAFADASDEQLDRVIDVTLDCIDFRQLLVDTFLADGEISEDSANCLGDALDRPEILRPMAFAGFRGTDFGEEPEVLELVFGAIVECLSGEELALLGDS